MDSGGRGAVLVPFRLPSALERLRRAHDPVARLGIPAHVTVLFPFVPAAGLGPAHRARVAAIARATPAATVSFRRTAAFPGVAYLPPVPRGPFDALIRECAAAFPEYPPYDGAFEDVVPHLTLGYGDPRVVAAIRDAARPTLPITVEARSLAVFVEDADGRWRLRWRMPLAQVRS